MSELIDLAQIAVLGLIAWRLINPQQQISLPKLLRRARKQAEKEAVSEIPVSHQLAETFDQRAERLRFSAKEHRRTQCQGITRNGYTSATVGWFR